MNRNNLLAALLCSLIPLAQAADETNNMDEVVVTATRVEQPLKETLSSTTVITQEDIQNSQAPDLVAILRSVVGVEYGQSGGLGKNASLFLRGTNSTQVLVLLDGVRFNSATTGSSAFQELMLDQIERIEIVRGNVSSVYGSEAIGGVVQIFTKKGRGEPRFNASVGVGDLGTQRSSAGLGGSTDKTQYHIQASIFETVGVSAINPKLKSGANPDTDGYRNNTVSANIKHTLSEGNNISATAFNSMGFNQYDNEFDTPTDIHTSKQQISKYSLAIDNTLSSDWRSHLQYGLGLDDNHTYKNHSPAATGRIKTSSQQLSWQNAIQFSTTSSFQLGLENLVQTVDSNTNYTIKDRSINSVYAGYTGNYGSHRVQSNLRTDNNSQYGTANTGLLGYGYALSDNLKLTASYSTAFRAPTFNDLYYPGTSSNPLLRPEQSINKEAGIHFFTSQRSLDLVYFDNRIQDLINYDSTAKKTININQAIMDGVELAYTEQFGNTSLKSSYTVQNPRNEATGTPLARRAKQHGSLAISQKVGNWRWGAEWLNSGERTDSNKTLQSYDVFNLTSSVALNKETKLNFRADNITDQNDSNVYGYNPLGRTFFISMSYQQ